MKTLRIDEITPGPWVDGGSGNSPHTIMPCGPDYTIYAVATVERLADARLICAAPDLLAALDHLAERLTKAKEAGVAHIQLPVNGVAHRSILSALAKAQPTPATPEGV